MKNWMITLMNLLIVLPIWDLLFFLRTFTRWLCCKLRFCINCKNIITQLEWDPNRRIHISVTFMSNLISWHSGRQWRITCCVTESKSKWWVEACWDLRPSCVAELHICILLCNSSVFLWNQTVSSVSVCASARWPSVWRVSRGRPSSKPANTSWSRGTMKTTRTWPKWSNCSVTVSLFSDGRFAPLVLEDSTLNIWSRCVSESGTQKKAVVQWFARVSEVPLSKLKLLGREPHPQEIFYYEGRSCDDEVNAESILRPVQVTDARLPRQSNQTQRVQRTGSVETPISYYKNKE